MVTARYFLLVELGMIPGVRPQLLENRMASNLGRRCSICSDPARRKAIDAELIAGTTVAATYRLFAPSMGFSEASIYRHARHRHDPAQPLGVQAPDGESPADNARVLVKVQRNLLSMLDRAQQRNDDKLAVLAGDRLRALVHESNELLGFTPAVYSEELDSAKAFIRSIADVAEVNPDIIANLAAGYDAINDSTTARELTAMSEYFTRKNKNKI